MTSSRGKASSRDVSCLVSPTGSTAEGPHRPALLSGCQQAAEAAHCRAREQKQVRDDCLSDTVQILSVCLFFFSAPQEIHLENKGIPGLTKQTNLKAHLLLKTVFIFIVNFHC